MDRRELETGLLGGWFWLVYGFFSVYLVGLGLDYLPSWSGLEEGYVADAVEAVL